MRTLAEFKRLAQKGAIFTAFWPNGTRDGLPICKTREVVNVQTNAVIFGQEKSYFYFPKTDNLSFIDGVMVEYNHPEIHNLPSICRMPILAYAFGDVFPEGVKAILCEQHKTAREAEEAEYNARFELHIKTMGETVARLRGEGNNDDADLMQSRIDFLNNQEEQRKATKAARIAQVLAVA